MANRMAYYHWWIYSYTELSTLYKIIWYSYNYYLPVNYYVHACTAYRYCSPDGNWDVVNVTECQNAELQKINNRIENDLITMGVVDIIELEEISTYLSIITNSSGVAAIAPNDLNTTNSILGSLIK